MNEGIIVADDGCNNPLPDGNKVFIENKEEDGDSLGVAKLGVFNDKLPVADVALSGI